MNRRFVNRISLSVVLLLLPLGTYATDTPATGLSLREAVDTALGENPVSASAAAGQETAHARLLQARTMWLPEIQLTENFVRSDNPVFVFGSLLEQGRFGPQHFDPAFLNNPDYLRNYRTNLNIRYPIFDQLRRFTMNQQAAIGVKAADAQSDGIRQQLRFQTIRAYYGVLVAEAGKNVADDAVQMAQAMVERVRNSYETGLVVESDYLAAQTQLADFQQKQIQANGNLRIAQQALAAALGEPTAIVRPLSGTLVDREFTIADTPELVKTALADRADARGVRYGERVSELGIRAAAGQFLPRLDGFATIGASGIDPTTSGRDTMVGAMVTLNVFEPARLGRLAEAKAARKMATAERRRTEDQIRLEVIQAVEGFLTARQSIVVASHAVDQAADALRIVQDRYGEGLTTITEVLRAETANVQAEMNLLASRNDLYTGYARVLLATGQLKDVTPFESE
ncbi:MAG: TolC family protein [Thermoanaerobaculia bacterium]